MNEEAFSNSGHEEGNNVRKRSDDQPAKNEGVWS